MSDRDYCYPPDYTVLRNRLDIRDAPALEAAERELVALRLLEPVPAGDFDLNHLKAIHRHLFQDVYAWAGEVRTVEIAKGDSRFHANDSSVSLHLGPSGLPVKSLLFPLGTLMPSAREGPPDPPARDHQVVGGVHPISPSCR